MDLENIILSELNQTETLIVYDITYMWNIKNSTNESIYKTATDLQTETTNFTVIKVGREYKMISCCC